MTRRPREVLDKVHQWLDACCRSVWVADPKQRTISAYRSDQPLRVYGEHDTLADEPLLPGFTLAIASCLAE